MSVFEMPPVAMPSRRPVTDTALAVIFAALALTGYGLLIAPAEDAQARRAVSAAGYRVDEIRRAPFSTLCARNRTGYAWRSGQISGRACIGGLMPPSVEAW